MMEDIQHGCMIMALLGDILYILCIIIIIILHTYIMHIIHIYIQTYINILHTYDNNE